MTECPKCGFDQVPSGECPQCGIIIAKYRERHPAGGVQPTEEYRHTHEGSHQAGYEQRSARPGRGAPGQPEGKSPLWLEKSKGLLKNLTGRFTPDEGQGNLITDALFHGLLMLVITLIVYTALLYAMRVMWIFYAATPVGEQFVGGFTKKAQEIEYLLDLVSPLFALEVAMTAFLICLAVGAGSRFLHITSSIYVSIGAPGRILLCGLPLTAVVASCLQPRHGFEVWSVAYAAALVPTLALYSVCFSISSAVLPEFGELLKRAAPLRAAAARRILGFFEKPGL